MASTHRSLTAQSTERTSRLAALKSLKRKQPSSSTAAIDEPSTTTATTFATTPSDSQPPSTPDVTVLHLSQRNYDPSTRGPKLGFEQAPTSSLATPTLETQAAALLADAAAQKETEREEAGKPLDLRRLRPGRVNEDLKRDLEAKMERVNVRTENAIARLVRERVEGQKGKVGRIADVEGEREGEDVGMGGGELVEGVKMREREEREDLERERKGFDDMVEV